MIPDDPVSAFVTLLVVVDPPALAPIFLGVTAGMSEAERRRVAYRASLIATLALAFFALLGGRLLGALGITIPAFRISGGLLLFWIAFEMVFERRTQRKAHTAEVAVKQDHIEDVAAFPLAIPLMAGPGAFTAVILLAAQARAAAGLIQLLIVIALVMGVSLAALLLSGRISRWLGVTGNIVVTRLLGVLLAAMAVQYVVDGVRAAFAPP